MIRRWMPSGLLQTGAIDERVLAIRDAVVNLFVIRGPAGLVCVDSGWRPAAVARGFASLGLDFKHVQAVLLTHAHWDHARAAGLFPAAMIYVGESEPVSRRLPPAERVCDGQVLTAGGLAVRVVATPGHTRGSVSYVIDQRLLFTGDVLRLKGGRVVPNYRILTQDRSSALQSIQKLAQIAGIACLLTGHSGLTHRPAEAFQNFRNHATRREPCASC